MPRYLVWFSHHNAYYNMRFHELEALASLFNGPNTKEDLYCDTPPTALDDIAYAYVNLPDEETARRILGRSVLIKMVIEVWADAPSHVEAQRIALEPEACRRRRELWLNASHDQSFSFATIRGLALHVCRRLSFSAGSLCTPSAVLSPKIRSWRSWSGTVQ